jgi:hypothetical protein
MSDIQPYEIRCAAGEFIRRSDLVGGSPVASRCSQFICILASFGSLPVVSDTIRNIVKDNGACLKIKEKALARCAMSALGLPDIASPRDCHGALASR